MDVPLWAFLLASGFAVVGPFLAAVITSQHNAKMVDRQQSLERARWKEERDREHAMWLRERKYETYSKLLAAMYSRDEVDYENPGQVSVEDMDRLNYAIAEALTPAALLAPRKVYDVMAAAAAYTTMERIQRAIPNIDITPKEGDWPTTEMTRKLRKAIREDLGVVD